MKRQLILAISIGALLLAPQVSAVATDSVTVVAVGDIAQKTGHQALTAALTSRLSPDQVLLMGDLAYYQGTSQQFRDYFLTSWGVFTAKTWAVPGNHEYGTATAAGYRKVALRFGWPLQTSGDLWWDRNVAGSSWAVIGLDSERVSGSAGTRQRTFLKAALKRHAGQPTIVMWHKPRYSLGLHKNATSTDSLWQLATADPDVKLVLWGHDHNYQRRLFMFKNADGTKRYLDTFVVGTGGAELRNCTVPSKAPTLICGQNNFGVLKLSLTATSYAWQFVHTNDSVADRGSRLLS